MRQCLTPPYTVVGKTEILFDYSRNWWDETPYRLRGGCAVHMCFSNTAHDVHDLMNHVGWATESSAKY